MASSQTASTGSSTQTPPGGTFTPPSTKHHSHVQAVQGSAPQQAASGWQQTATSWGFWASSLFSAVGTAASKYGSTWQEHNDFYTIGMLLPGHLDWVPKLLQLFPNVERLTALLKAMPEAKLKGLLDNNLFLRLDSLDADRISSLVTRCEVDTLSQLTRSLGVALLAEYDKLFAADKEALDELAPYDQLLAGMQPASVQLLVQAFGTAGLADLEQLPTQQLELLAANAMLVEKLLPADEVKTYLDNLSIQEFIALCTVISTMGAGGTRLLKRMDVEAMYDLARLPAADIASVATCILDLSQAIGWQELGELGSDGVAAYLTAIPPADFEQILKVLKSSWNKLSNATLSLGEALRILVVNKTPKEAADILEKVNGSAAKLHKEANAADTFTKDKTVLQNELSPALLNAFDDAELKKLLQGMKAQEVAVFVTAIGDAQAVKALLQENVQVSALKKLTGAHTKTLLNAAGGSAAVVKELIRLVPDKLAEVAQQVPLPVLTTLLQVLTVAELANFVTACGLQDVGTRKGIVTLEATYTAASLKKYGATFFQKFQGVTNATMHHVVDGDGIKNDKVSGCHDQAKFMALDGNGITITANTPRGGTGVYDAAYTVDGSAALQTKTLIANLSGSQATWKQHAATALDDAIRQQNLIVGGRWRGTGGGHHLTGYYGGKTAHVADTFWVQ